MINVGIIGSGFGTVGLLPAFHSIRGCKVIGIAVRRGDWPALIGRDDIDAIAIATPPHAQYRIAREALKKGLHVFAEKPLAANAKQAKELLALARKMKVTHGVDFIFPEIAEWVKVKSMLESGKFGRLRHVSVNWEWLSNDLKLRRWSWRTSRNEGGGALSHYFSHGLYYLEYFAGSIIGASAVFAFAKENPNDGESGFDIALKFKKGITGDVHLSSTSRKKVEHRLIFTCDKGIIVLANHNAVVNNFTVKTFDKNGSKTVNVKKDTGRKGEDERVKIVRKLACRFIGACAHHKQTRPSFSDGVRVQELIERIRKTRF